MALKIVFCGSDAIALPSLEALSQAEFDFCAVYTQPDRPRGRGRKLTPGVIKTWVLEHEIKVLQPEKITAEVLQELQQLQPDIIIVMAYGIILPQAFLDIPRLGCVNLHVSLLPEWRGAAPIQRAVLAGDKETGITMMQMDEGLDTGAILAQYKTPITATTTSAALQRDISELGAQHLCQLIRDLDAGKITPQPQDDTKATYAKKLSKAEAEIDWNQTSERIDCMIRAFNPWPVAYFIRDEQAIRIWQAEILFESSTAEPGSVVAATKHGIDIATATSVIRITKLQIPGKKPMSAADVLNGSKQLFT